MTYQLPFAITCVSCGSRLKVTNSDLIGSIDRCPKCGAMVEIVTPKGEELGRANLLPSEGDIPRPSTGEKMSVGPLENVDSGAITQSEISHLSTPLSTSHQPASATELPSPPAPPHEVRDETAGSATSRDEAAEYRQELDVAWQSESTQRTKQLVLIASLSCFGLITAAIVFSQFVRTWKTQQAAATNSTVTAAADPNDASFRESAMDDVAEVQQPIDDGAEQATAEPSMADNVASPDEVATASPTPSDETPDNADAVAGEEVNKKSPPPVGKPSDAPGNLPPLVSAPFDISEPSNTPPIAVTRGDAAQNADSIPKMNNLPPGMQKFMPLLSLETAGNAVVPTLEAPPTIDTVRIDEAAKQMESIAPENPKRKPIDVTNALAGRYALENNGASIAELSLIMAQLTTVPIELEIIAFDAAGIAFDAPIKSPKGWLSAKDWIDSLCDSQGLIAQPYDGRLMITAKDEVINRAIVAALRLDDFMEDAAKVFQSIRPLLSSLEDEQEASKEIADELPDAAAVETTLSEDALTIIPGPSLRSRMRAVFAIESMRMMRNMPTKLDRRQTSRWMGPWPQDHFPSDPNLFGEWTLVEGGIGGPRLDTPRNAADLLLHLGTLNKMHPLVGWYSATQQDFFPADLQMPFSKEGTAAGMLDQILGDYGLQARVCGRSLWYVCTEADYDRLEVFAWYEIPPGTFDTVRSRLAKSLSIADPQDMPVVYENGRMLVRCPRYLARQMSKVISP